MQKTLLRFFLSLFMVLAFSSFVFAAVSQNSKEATVMVYAIDENGDIFSQGSGFIISNYGYIMTNHHVVEGAEMVMICFFEEKFSNASCQGIAEISASQEDLDLALLRLTDPSLVSSSVWFSDSNNLDFGDSVYVLGYPDHGGSSLTLTTGQVTGFQGQEIIKTDAQLSSGNSGGAVFDEQGNVIGVATAVSRGNFSNSGILISSRLAMVWLSYIVGINEISDTEEPQEVFSETGIPEPHELFDAIYLNHPTLVKELLERGADINAVDGRGFTPIVVAIINDRPAAAKVLLEFGANPNSFAEEMHLIEFAVNNIVMLNALLDAGANPNWGSKVEGAEGVTPIYSAIWNNDSEAVDALIEAGADVNSTYQITTLTTPLLDAISLKNPNKLIIKSLLEAGADSSFRGNYNYSIFGLITTNYLYEKKYDLETLKIFLESGANPNSSEGENEEPILITAATFGDIEVVDLLLDFGADTDIKIELESGNEVSVIEYLKTLNEFELVTDEIISLIEDAILTREISFTVDAGRSQFKDAIIALKNKDVVSGYDDGTFKPFNPINRAEFMKIVIGAVEIELMGGNCFSDVNEEWFAPYVCAGMENGIVDGYPDGSFKPDQQINVAEALKITLKAFEIETRAANSGEAWYAPFTEYARKNDYYLNTFDSDSKQLTREDMAELVYRLMPTE